MSQNSLNPPKNYSKSLQYIIFLLFLLGPLTGNVINVLFGVLSSYFEVTTDSVLIAIPAFMFPFAITQLFSGAISDVKGRVPVLIVGLILFTIAMLIATLSFNLEIYIIANVIGGIGFGFINPVLIALMTDITPRSDLPKKMGYLGASANLGVGLGPLIASQMILIGWQSIYILFIVITIFCLIYFIMVKSGPQKVSDDPGIRTFLTQISIEWRRFVVIIMVISAFLIAHTYIAINIWTSKILAHIIDTTIIGIVLGLAGIGAAISGILTGARIKRKGVRIPLITGSLVLILSLINLIIVGDITHPDRFIFIIPGWILAGISGGILFTIITFYSQVLSPERRGVLAGSLTAAYFIGIALVITTLAPFSNMFGITGVYITILIISLIFIITIIVLYISAKRVKSSQGKFIL
ncbi:MAG: MFS transporter [Promethearchaeota archaeon]|nr:MAG: MFS transporter [Candidatus Lokiarchaeota archaeon]